MSTPLVKLGDVCETTSGGTPLKSHKEYYEGGTIPWLRSGEVCKKDIEVAECFITPAGMENSSAKLFPVNTVLVAMYGATAGQVGILRFPATTNQAICGILPSTRFVPEFLYYALLQQKAALVRRAVGGAQPNISQEKIREVILPLPSLAEQERIVAHLERTLGAIDAMEAKFREMAETAERHFRATLAETFADLREKCPIQTLAELEDAGRIRLGRGQIISRKDLLATPGDYPVYSSAAVGEGIFGHYGKYMFEDPRITWSIDGGGRFFFRKDVKYSVTNVCGWLKVEDCKLDNLFLYYALYSEWVKKTFDYTHKAHPSVIRREYDLPIPPLDEQTRVANWLLKMRQQTATIAQRARHAKGICGVYRRAVLSEAFGGRG